MKKIISVFTAFAFLFGGVAFPALALASNLDTNNDGYISTVEGQPAYGSIQTSLTTSGDTSANSGLALKRFPVSDGSGNLFYSRTFTVPQSVVQDIRNGEAVVVQHGIDINRDGKYDGSKTSQLADVPFGATVPTTCGVLEPAAGPDDFVANLSQLNSTGGHGIAFVHLDGNQVQVSITSSGLSRSLPHAQHFHIGGNHVCPSNTTGVEQGNNNMDTSQKISILQNISNLLGQVQNEIGDIQDSINERIDALMS